MVLQSSERLEKGNTEKLLVDNLIGWQPPYEIIHTPDSNSSKLEVRFTRKNIPLKAEFQLDRAGNLLERIQLGERRVQVDYRYHPETNELRPVSLGLESDGSDFTSIDLITLDPEVETSFTLPDHKSVVSLFAIHPDMNPKKMFGGTANFEGQFDLGGESEQSWSVYFEGDHTGFTIPKVLYGDRVAQMMKDVNVPVDTQIFILPNDGNLPVELTGVQIDAVPVVIGNLFSYTKTKDQKQPPKIVMTSQRMGHAKVVNDMLLMATVKHPDIPASRGISPNDISAYFVPTKDLTDRVNHSLAIYKIPPESVRGWCYAPEKGYGEGRLADPTKKMIAVLATNPHLVKEVMTNAQRGLLVYSDTKAEAGYFNMLAKMMGIPLHVVIKAYRIFDRVHQYGEVESGAEIDEVMHRATEAFAGASGIFKSLGRSTDTPDAVEFMHEKMTAAFDGTILYTTDGFSAEIPTQYGNSNIVPIPLAFLGRSPDKEYMGLDAKKRLVKQIRDQKGGNPNVSDEILQMVEHSDPDQRIGVVALQLGTSNNLYSNEAMKLIVDAARQMPNTLFVLTGLKQKVRYLAQLGKVLEIPLLAGISYDKIIETIESKSDSADFPPFINESLSIIESHLPNNVAVLGMRRDIAKIDAAVDVLISTASIGNTLDAVISKTALITLGPDTVVAKDTKKIEAIIQSRGIEVALDDIAVMAETVRERAGDVAMIAQAYARNGIPPDNSLLHIAETPSVEEAVHDISYALDHKKEMAEALQNIKYMYAEELLDVLLLIRDGATVKDISEFIRLKYPDFHPRRIDSMPANLDELQTRYNI